jgi:hypothetical protein
LSEKLGLYEAEFEEAKRANGESKGVNSLATVKELIDKLNRSIPILRGEIGTH